MIEFFQKWKLIPEVRFFKRFKDHQIIQKKKSSVKIIIIFVSDVVINDDSS